MGMMMLTMMLTMLTLRRINSNRFKPIQTSQTSLTLRRSLYVETGRPGRDARSRVRLRAR